MGTLTIRLDEQLEQDLTRLATRTHRTKSDLAREMLRKHLALAKLRELRGELMPYAEAAGYLTDDDVFQDVS
ncbi:MAG: ribbon-helix-helix protein, CopG family [Candidatus Competibacter sp.]|jgi:predicted transcriptional regulator|nr:ribbon-helix-helix protein, CopG family [Candidatus Competibacter sp.]